jgi:hypothetical protein
MDNGEPTQNDAVLAYCVVSWQWLIYLTFYLKTNHAEVDLSAP